MSSVYRSFDLELYHPETCDSCSVEFDLEYEGYYYYPQTWQDPADEGYSHCTFQQDQVDKLNELLSQGWLLESNDASETKQALMYVEKAAYSL